MRSLSVIARDRLRFLAIGAALLGICGLAAGWTTARGISGRETAVSLPALEPEPPESRQDGKRKTLAPEFSGGVAWLNSSGPISIKDLRGKFVVVDFWTFCCINCIHTLPELARLEKKYPNELVVIGVHSAKFENEKSTENIRKAILRYEISHPVVNDANMAIWQAYGSRSWPTLVLIDPEGFIMGVGSGEGLGDPIDAILTKQIPVFRAKNALKEEPLRFDLARYKERAESPLFFPGKVLADAATNRLFIADSTHHRIVITDLSGKKLDVAGTGEVGKADGSFDSATLNDPQGMALKGDTLFVADRRNHLLRALDLKARTVKTIAGLGKQGEDRFKGGPAATTGLNSPWDLLLIGDKLFIAMAGHHQIWTLDLASQMLTPYAGNGREDIRDGTLDQSSFAQPSGLATDGTSIFVADSEVSAVRSVPLKPGGTVESPVGQGLFEFGDVDGIGDKVRLQHALGVACYQGKVYIADTYNSKIKVLDPATRACISLLGGKQAQWQAGDLFNEPAGLSVSGDKLYVADTNNHRVRVVDMKTHAVSTLELKGVLPPKQAVEAEAVVFPNPSRKTLPAETVSTAGDLAFQVSLQLAPGLKLNSDAPMTYQVETIQGDKASWSEKKQVAAGSKSFAVTVPANRLQGTQAIRLSVVYYECAEGNGGLCRVKSQIWEVPVRLDAAAARKPITLAGPS